VRIWLLRALWVALPLLAGPAAADALASWAGGPQVVGAIELWGAWAVGVVALLAPRPVGLTALRTIAPALLVAALVALATGATGDLAGWAALAVTGACTVGAFDDPIAIASANSTAYGDERRYPLRTPPGLYLGPLPLARVVVAAALVAGPLLLADGRIGLGLLALVLGAPLVVVGGRALHGLSRRWLVLVPAGVVVVDPLTLADPMLFVRRHVRSLRPLAVGPRSPRGTDGSVLDLRLGAGLGSLAIALDEEADLVRAARGRHGGRTVHASEILVAVTRRAELLDAAAERRVRVEPRDPAARDPAARDPGSAAQAATPPPTSASPS